MAIKQMSSQQKLSVVIHTHTSPPELAPLHTFNAEHPHCQLIRCKQSGCLFRSHRGLEFSTHPSQPTEVLGFIQPNHEACVITPCTNLGLLLACPGLVSTPHELQVSDEVRVGSVSLVVRQIQDSHGTLRTAADHASGFCKQVAMTQTCRVCFEEAGEDLVNPCHCRGSVGAVHIRCLQHWLDTKLAIRRLRRVLSLIWSKFYCELCGQEYPDDLIVNGRVHSLLRLPVIRGQHIVLENKQLVRRNKVMHIVFSDKEVVLGSALSADIQLKDVSVSRRHAILKWSAAGPCIEDNGSEFGTCIMLARPVSVRVKESLALQAGPTVLLIQVKKKRTLSCLFCGAS